MRPFKGGPLLKPRRKPGEWSLSKYNKALSAKEIEAYAEDIVFKANADPKSFVELKERAQQ